MIGVSLFAGKKVELTAVEVEKDASALSKWVLRPSAFQHILTGNYHAVKESEMKKRLTDLLKKAEEKRSSYFFSVRTLSECKLIGFAQIPWIFQSHQTGRIAVDFGSDDDLAAYGDETLQLLQHYAFMEVNLYHLSTSIPAYEAATISLYERNGFLLEVRRREANYHQGKYFDELDYAQLRPEFQAHVEVLP